MLEKFDEELVKVFEEAAENTFASLIKKHSEEHFYYFAFLLDGSFMPYISAWSYEALDKLLAEEEIDEEEEKLWYKWGACESPYAGYGYDEYFSKYNEFLSERERIAEEKDEESDEYEALDMEFNLRINSMEEAMRRLDKAGVFGTGNQRKEVVITAEIVPPEYSNNERAERLNAEGLIKEYLEVNSDLEDEE